MSVGSHLISNYYSGKYTPTLSLLFASAKLNLDASTLSMEEVVH